MYTATSIDVFIAAYTGAMGSYNNGRIPNSDDPTHYTRVSRAALAYAEEFDLIFAVALPNELQLSDIESISGEVCPYPNNDTSAFIPANYLSVVNAVIAMMSENSAIVAANVTNPIPVPTPVSSTVLTVATVVGVADSLMSTVPTSAVSAIVEGYYAAGDHGSAPTYFWDPLSVSTHNGGTIFNPTGHVGAGRWLAITDGSINARQWGVKGVGVAFNDTVPLQALLDYLVAQAISASIYLPPVGRAAYYNLATQLVITGSFSQAISLIGDQTTPDGVGGTQIRFTGAAGTKGAIDIPGGNYIRLENIDLQLGGLALYGIWYHPGAVGADNFVLNNVNIYDPQDDANACCLAVGPESGPVTQADLVSCTDCKFFGNTTVTYLASGFRNLSGSNAKNFAFYNCHWAAFKYAINVGQYGGPITFYENGVTNCHTSAIFAGSSRLSFYGLDFETNDHDCKLLTGSFGDGTGNVAFYESELFYQDGAVGLATNDIIIDWGGGQLGIYGCHLQNVRNLTITAATNVPNIVCTVGAAHGVVLGDRVQIVGGTGNTGVNTPSGKFTTVVAVGATTVTIDQAGNGAYTGGASMHFEPKIQIESATVGTGNPKSGVDSRGNTWHSCASNLPIYDRNNPLIRVLDYSQTLPAKIRSFGDVGFQPGAPAPCNLAPMNTHDWIPGALGNVRAAWSASDGVTTVNSLISLWKDPYGGADFVQATVANRPAWRATALAGWPIADFDGANDVLTVAYANAQPLTIYIVAKFDSDVINTCFLDGFTTNTGRAFRTALSALSIGDGGGGGLSPSPLDLQNWHVHVIQLNGVTSLYQQENGIGFVGNGGVADMGGITLGELGTGGFNADCSIAEVWSFGVAHSQADIDKVVNYLATKFAIPVPVPFQAVTNSTTGVASATTYVDVTTGGLADPAKVNNNFATLIAMLRKAGIFQ